MKIVLIILCVLCAIICIIGFIVTISPKLYTKYFDREEWKVWESIIKNKEKIIFDEYYNNPNNPNITNYQFLIDIGRGACCRIIWFTVTDRIGVFEGNFDYIACSYDRYHANKLRNYLREQFKIGA